MTRSRDSRARLLTSGRRRDGERGVLWRFSCGVEGGWLAVVTALVRLNVTLWNLLLTSMHQAGYRGYEGMASQSANSKLALQ